MTNEFEVDGIRLAYHVAGTGPVCLVHPGGPGVHYEQAVVKFTAR